MERFLKVPHRIFLHLVRLSRREKCPSLIMVYLALLYHANRDGQCFPGYERIMELSGVRSTASVAKALQVLEAHKFIKVERKRGGVNLYLLLQPLQSLKDTPLMSEGVPLQSLKDTPLMSEDELYSFNYNHLTIPKELKKGEGERSGSNRKHFGMPEDPGLDVEYYLS